MNERPSFYPKHLARQYVSSTRCSDTRPKAEVRPLDSETETKIGAKKFVFAPAITSSTVYLPSARSQENVVPGTTTTTTVIRQPQEIEANCDQSKPSSKVLSGLPDSFVEAMRRLFNLMDTKSDGRIKFEDIATQWSNGDSDRNLPSGVVASLSKVATQDGYLTFERFCAGIKISILRQEASEKKRKLEEAKIKNNSCGTDSNISSSNGSHSSNSSGEFSTTSLHSGSDGMSTTSGVSSPTSFSARFANSREHSNKQSGRYEHENTSIHDVITANRSTASSPTSFKPPVTYQSPISPIPGNKRYESVQYGNHFVASPLSRTSSLPILPGALKAVPISDQQDYINGQTGETERFAVPSPVPSEPWGGKGYEQEEDERRKINEGPPKPPRDPSRMSGLFTRGSTNSLPASSHHHGAVAYPNISSYIQVDRTEAPIQFIWKSPPPEMRMPSIANYQNFSIIVDENTKRSKPASNDIVVLRKQSGSFRAGGPNGGHSTRRHTLQNGADVTMMRRVKLWEDEKSVLEDGLATIERIQAAYRERLSKVENDLKYCTVNQADLGAEQAEAAQERVMFELKNIREINHRLTKLGMPSQPDSQVQPGTDEAHSEMTNPCSERRILRLQDQNRMLTEEVGRKSEMITVLEQEKLSLIRQLFQQQAAAATSSSSSGGSDTIKSGTSFKLNTANHTHSQIPQPQKLSLNKTIHLDIKKLC